MKAAVISSSGQAPHYRDIDEPLAVKPGEMQIQVLAAGLHHLTRGMAAGAHYSSRGHAPLVAGMDGVGRGSDGKLRYFVQGPGQPGTMAERTVIELHHSITLPDDCDPVLIAGTMNPAMASWMALRCRLPSFRARLPLQRGKRVLILGATGCSGRLAVQIARHLGASQVLAAGRNAARLAALPALGATGTVTLGAAELGHLASEVDVVLDFVWGECCVRTMEAILRQRSNRSQPLDWLHVGSMAGDVAPIPGAFLRSARLQVMGSGLGAISGREMLAELPELVRTIARGTFKTEVRALPLSEVERAWSDDDAPAGRIVFTP
ncbi:zinc-binding alcohol dehydrogenase family protein [Comamonas flocculans]|uniref:Zinc-binding alcohol dehydrogenase family protein n=1 Tax=Comamonas flocculans TaxID=2597701 RepID=A0A5B8RXA3_9BURK|nr:zinc-binding alcohol dehydrogenase family protein [Comamonas flocculans]QEA14130.1 zinc-binding alcohol dehydrogenase family protein [Comamonas flocculans]